MTVSETGASASYGSDWHDTTPIEADEREQRRRLEAARRRLDPDLNVGRLQWSSDSWTAAKAVRHDTDLIGRVMLGTITGGAEPADVDPADITAALSLIAPVRQELDKLESQVMMIARRQGMSWRVIAEALGLLSPQAAAQRWERLTGAVAPAVGALRRRVTSALLDGTVTRAEAKVFVGGGEGRTVIVQLSASGPTEVRQDVARRVIAALRAAGLDLTDEGSHSINDMAGYLADGRTAEVFERGTSA